MLQLHNLQNIRRMICQRCLRRSRLENRLVSSSLQRSSARRSFSSTSRTNDSDRPSISPGTTSNAQPRQPSGASSATSTSAAQPFSTPLTPSPDPQAIKDISETGASPPPKSSFPGGVPLQGLAYLRDRTDPVALEDSEYPAWLWGCLSSKNAGKDEAAAAKEADTSALYSNSKKARQAAGRRLRKQAALNPDLLAPPVPVHEQSVDLKYNADPTNVEATREAREVREEVTASLRGARRKAIKESNYLKQMG